MERGVRRILQNLPFVAEHVLRDHLRTEGRRERIEVVLVLRQHLDPQVAHFIAGALPPEHFARRPVGIPQVLRRVVVGEGHRQLRPLRERERLGESIEMLPAKIPVGDVKQRLRGAVWERRRARHLAR